MVTELIGWAAAAILVATIGRQVYTQWRAGTTAGVSKWAVYRPGLGLDRLRRL
jgi:MtN3 and saliva related transmembrane protein